MRPLQQKFNTSMRPVTPAVAMIAYTRKKINWSAPELGGFLHPTSGQILIYHCTRQRRELHACTVAREKALEKRSEGERGGCRKKQTETSQMVCWRSMSVPVTFCLPLHTALATFRDDLSWFRYVHSAVYIKQGG